MIDKIDPHNSQEKFTKWLKNARERGIDYCTLLETSLILEHLEDLRAGVNVGIGSKKGARSFIRLNSIAHRLSTVVYFIKKKFGEDKTIVSLKSSELLRLFASIREGELISKQGRQLRDADSLAKSFAAFWHWYQKREREAERETPDITLDLQKSSNPKAAWVYLTEQQVRQLADASNPYYRSMILFVYDALIRAPTELNNVRVSDLSEENGVTFLNIRGETSKTFGRKIKLMFCVPVLKEFMLREGLSNDDYLFNKTPASINKYLRRKSQELFGTSVTQARGRYDQLSVYDLRHNSACYWIKRYKRQQDLMYRAGWTKPNMIMYYTELLGLTDTISDEDMLVGTSVTALEKELAREREARLQLEESVKSMQEGMEGLHKEWEERFRLIELWNSALEKNPSLGQEVRMLRPGTGTSCPPQGFSRSKPPNSIPSLNIVIENRKEKSNQI